MTIHKTASGYAESIYQWRDGQASGWDLARRPAHLISDDGDGHYRVWRVTGKMRDAAAIIGAFDLRNDGRNVMVFYGSRVVSEPTPEGFWRTINDWGDVAPDLIAFPEIVAY